ncbi:A/G-specific adenine glycosylase [Pseudobacteriovorax antillogorgiicola]|uniref:Adenine DNA glycosylase n=1 Tax=Pseudobacteriovorax antillogorgiicola TaxID=1513793 RepID=A0A1Y6BIS0_9BACT|nr:A/G-specific adenine glycosylase [Pseudobacteriovorax antillogorgiicola]TCS55353.1 A/G-specific DNA-adenine glycosylase [Pseudobacteriovorax antillogorgiicola]SMF13744.1 A/G-specific DNA-adenine glycosylase [Pseudobacteriovorax antillogorgiicola]
MIDHIENIADLPLHFTEPQFRDPLLSWYQKNKRPLPWRLVWMQTQDPYVVWVSEIMLQQTVIKAVIPAYDRFLKAFPSYKHLADASEDQVRLASRGLGYYRRFRMLHQAAQHLNDHPEDVWPTNFKAWKALPGVGDYTAAAIASICFNDAVPVVDGNVERVFCRLFDIRLIPNLPRLKRKFFELGQSLISVSHPGDYNQAVMELGQTICTKQNPNCSQCPVAKVCLAKNNSSQTLAPQSKQKIVYESVGLRLYIPSKSQKIGLIQRPENSKFLKGTWGFPTAIEDQSKVAWDGKLPFTLPRAPCESLGTIRHSITKHKIQAQIFPWAQKNTANYRWFEPEDVEENLVSNLDRKAWKAYLRHL